MNNNKNFFERMFCDHEINVYENQSDTATNDKTDTRQSSILSDNGLNSGLGETISSIFASQKEDKIEEVNEDIQSLDDLPLFSIDNNGGIDGVYVVDKDDDSNDDVSMLNVKVDDFDVTEVTLNDINNDGDLEDDIIQYLKSSNLNNLSDNFDNVNDKDKSKNSDDDLDMPLL